MAISSSSTKLSVESLRTEFPGRVIAPGDVDYDPADATTYAHRPFRCQCSTTLPSRLRHAA